MEPIRLGRYVVEQVLGKGAMGTVYVAKDPVIGRRVALKALNVPAEVEEAEEFRQRFLREAQAAGILNHPGIVTVHDAGVDEATGLSFIAMEWVEGKTLRDLLRGGHMFAFSEVARIGAALAAALDYAHSKGVVHRDIKPANILVTPQGQAKITDFGVARLESSNLTATGQFIGTPNYMAPEQVSGSPVDGRSDLFSLGVVLFELMTGQRPFVGGSVTEVSYKIAHEPAPIPSQVRPGLPPAFNPIVLKLLEKDPSKRYQKGADVARALDALRRVLAGVGGEVVGQAPAPRADAGSAMNVAATATRATSLDQTPPETAAPPATPSIWKLSIEPRWVAILVTAALIPPLVASIVLFAKIERGPWPTPAPGEPERRHRIGAALRSAREAIALGRPGDVERILADVWDQAPYAMRARELRARAAELQGRLVDRQAREEQSGRLIEEGKSLVHQGRFREAIASLERAANLVPDDPLAQEWLDYARERARSPRAARSEPRELPKPVAAPTEVATGPTRLELYFNSPLPAGTITVLLDGQPVHDKSFNFYQKGFLGTKKKGTGIVEDALSVPSGKHALTVRLTGDGKGQSWEQQLPVELFADGRYMLKIEMDGESAVPKFSLNSMRAR